MKKLRLIKLVVTPVLAVDDGETLVEHVAQAFNVTEKELDDFPERFRRNLAEAQEALE